jgi:hypothetical protein
VTLGNVLTIFPPKHIGVPEPDYKIPAPPPIAERDLQQCDYIKGYKDGFSDAVKLLRLNDEPDKET